MSKYHVNERGEAGRCHAQKGGCPFGGEAEHYGSADDARQAYEHKMENGRIEDNLFKPSGQRDAAVEYATLRRAHNSSEWGGYAFDALVFDHFQVEEDIREWLPSNTPKAVLQSEVDRVTERRRKSWDAKARTDVAKSGEKGVPIRLIPTGTELTTSNFGGVHHRRKVGHPVDNGSGQALLKRQSDAGEKVLAKYWNGIQWDYVSGHTLFNTLRVPRNKKPARRWARENAQAADLAYMRQKYASSHPDI